MTAALLGTSGWFLISAIEQGKDVVIAREYAPVSAALIFDTAPRMQYLEANKSRLEKAQETGEWIIGQFPSDSEVSIVDSATIDPYFSADISAAKKRLKGLEHSYLVRPLMTMLRDTVEMLEKSENGQREIYIFSDLSTSAWNADQGGIASLLEQKKDISIYLIDVSAEEPTNFLISEILMSAESTTENGVVEVRGTVERKGPAGRQTIQLTMEQNDDRLPVRRDGKTLFPESKVIATTDVEIPQDGSAEFSFQVSGLTPGIHHGTVAMLGQDGLAFDTIRYVSILVREAWRVAVVTGPDVLPNNVSDTLEEDSGSQYEIKTMPQSALSGNDLAKFQAVFVLDPKPLDEGQWSQLFRYVEQGGNLFFNLGSNAAKGKSILDSDTPDESFNSELAQNLLPGELQNVWRAPPRGRFVKPDDYAHPTLNVFQPYATTNPWTNFPVARHWGLELSNDASVDVLLKFSDGSPAIIEHNVGLGKVLTMTSPITEVSQPEDRKRWNDLMIGDFWPCWLLIRNMGRYLVSSREARVNYYVGETMNLANDPSKFPSEYQLFTPHDDDPSRVLVDDEVLAYQFTDIPGQFRLKGKKDVVIRRGFSVNATFDESDLSKIDPQELDKILGAKRYELARNQDEITRQQGSTRVGQQFFPMLIGFFAIFFLLEHLMANWFYQTNMPARNRT